MRFALRALARQPDSSLLIIGMLALGIAGTTAIFSIFNGLFLRPLPFAGSERLVNLDETAPKWNLEYTGIAYPGFDAWRSRNRLFDGMAVFTGGSFNLSERGSAPRRRQARRTKGGGARLRRVAADVRRPPGRARPNPSAQRRAVHHSGRSPARSVVPRFGGAGGDWSITLGG